MSKTITTAEHKTTRTVTPVAYTDLRGEVRFIVGFWRAPTSGILRALRIAEEAGRMKEKRK